MSIVIEVAIFGVVYSTYFKRHIVVQRIVFPETIHQFADSPVFAVTVVTK